MEVEKEREEAERYFKISEMPALEPMIDVSPSTMPPPQNNKEARLQSRQNRKKQRGTIQRPASMNQNTQPRNEPCNCGSGIKYKKCHGKP